jgi:hypothetical protein
MLCTMTINLIKGLKKIVSKGNLVDSRLDESRSPFSIMNISANLKPKSEQLEGVNQNYLQHYKNNAIRIN